MAYVYILQSERNGKYYIGSTGDINRRWQEHSQGDVHSTKRLLPLKIVFRQECENINLAKKIET